MSQTLHSIIRRIRGGSDEAGPSAQPPPPPPPAVTRVTTELRKARYRFVPPGDPGFRWHGHWAAGNDGAMISKEPGAYVEWVGPVAGAVPVLMCHPWSGILRIEAPGHAQVIDNYAWFPFAKAFPLAPTLRDGPLRIAAIGRNPLARGDEMVVAGLWLPDDTVTETPADDPAAFEELQARMVDNWMENIRRGGRSMEDVNRQREDAYLHRWAEVLPYAPPGSRVLDLGGGFTFGRLYAFWAGQGFDYTAIDIDRRAVETNRANGPSHGFGAERFLHGRNTQLDVPDGSADLVFASHCIEHSDDLPQTSPSCAACCGRAGISSSRCPPRWIARPSTSISSRRTIGWPSPRSRASRW
jgi:hypothetical protein